MTNLTPQEIAAGRNVMKQCLAVKPDETVLVVTDPDKKLEANIFYQTAKEFTQAVELVSFTGMTGNAQEPPPTIAKKIKMSNVVLLITRYSLSHTQARKNACESGCRIASLPGITREMISRTLTADYTKIAQLSIKLAQILTSATTARLTTPTGTDLSLKLNGRLGDADTGLYTKSGSWGNLPAGEASIGPLEGQTQGTLIIDGTMAEIELDQPIEIKIKDGFAVNITGGRAAQKLKAQLNQAGRLAYQVAELGIGTNPLAQLSANVLEAEKVYGTCHVALGSNISYGGMIDVPFHGDGVILQPTLQIDGKMIIKDGKFFL